MWIFALFVLLVTFVVHLVLLCFPKIKSNFRINPHLECQEHINTTIIKLHLIFSNANKTDVEISGVILLFPFGIKSLPCNRTLNSTHILNYKNGEVCTKDENKLNGVATNVKQTVCYGTIYEVIIPFPFKRNNEVKSYETNYVDIMILWIKSTNVTRNSYCDLYNNTNETNITPQSVYAIFNGTTLFYKERNKTSSVSGNILGVSIVVVSLASKVVDLIALTILFYNIYKNRQLRILANNSKLLFILGIVLVITDIFSYLWIFTTIDIDIREDKRSKIDNPVLKLFVTLSTILLRLIMLLVILKRKGVPPTETFSTSSITDRLPGIYRPSIDSNQNLTTANLAAVYEACYDARTKWYAIGLKLIPNNDAFLEDLEWEKNNEVRLQKVLRKWLQTDKHATFSDVIHCLNHSTVERQVLAERLMTKSQSL